MAFIDLNCDMGEGMATDAAIMPFISSANIACGYHAGDIYTMKRTIEGCLEHKIAIGAHPSFFDRGNFGRSEMNITTNEIYDLVTQQLFIIHEIADSFEANVVHVKPHGALYNLSVKNKDIAATIAQTVKDFDPELVLFGLSGSLSITEAKVIGLKTASEVFADRSYQDDGSLTTRTAPGALIEDEEKALQQVLQMIQEKKVTALSGKIIPVEADTVCLHSDGKHALAFAKNIHHYLKQQGIDIKAISI